MACDISSTDLLHLPGNRVTQDNVFDLNDVLRRADLYTRAVVVYPTFESLDEVYCKKSSKDEL